MQKRESGWGSRFGNDAPRCGKIGIMKRSVRSVAPLVIVAAIQLAVVVPAAFGQESHQWSVDARPAGAIPLGSSADLFTFGMGTEVEGIFLPRSLRIIGAKAGVSYLSLPLNSPAPDRSIWTMSAFAGPHVRFPLGERLSLVADATVGYYVWDAAGWDAGESTGGDPVFGGGAGARFRVAGPVTLGAEVSYDYYANLYNGLNVTLSASLDFPALEKETGTLELQDIRVLPLFPVLYGYYATNSVGSVTVRNTGSKPAEGITLQVFVERYMDNPMTVGQAFSLAPGEETTVALHALFNESLMEITEGTKTSVRVTARYPGKNDVYITEATGILDFYNRNAMTWDDDRKIASFITAKDPEILNFARNTVTWMQEVENPALDGNLQRAMALFEAVKTYGIRYQIDPATPFAELSETTHAVDYLQFPRQTLQYTNGDCDDLTTLYTSLLEAVGVESGFITIPGHIYAAFALDQSPDEARRTFNDPADLIFIDNKVWVPVEITMFQETFREAWSTGAKEWREHSGADQAVLHPVREAWTSYQAVGFREGSAIALPDRRQVTDAVQAAITGHVEREIFPQVERLQERLQTNPNDIRRRNQLAVVYARYGLYDNALEEFLRILNTQEYPPALTNVANIYYLRGDLAEAADYYDRALNHDEDNQAALLGLARCNYDMENYGLVRQTYGRIQELDPELAERFAYLDLRADEETRASAVAELSNTVVWEEAE